MTIPSETNVPNLVTALKGPLLALEKCFLDNQIAIEAWFRKQWEQTPPLFYGSVDIRNAGFKVAPVDTNLFPAGFNNLDPEVYPLCIQAIQATIAEIHPEVTRLLIIPESHSRNSFYFENLATLQSLLIQAGFETRIGSLDPELTFPKTIKLASNRSLRLEPIQRHGTQVGLPDFFPCCIILNNDLSSGIPPILQDLTQTIIPTPQLGWTNRLKSEHFRQYSLICQEFAHILGINSWLISPLFDQCPEVDFMDKAGQHCLYERANSIFQKIKMQYNEQHIEKKPFLFVKADAGTYGMAVMMIQEPEELLELNRKQRTHMSTIKGGRAVTKAIIQEGIPTFETIGEEQAVAEPVVYLIGRHVVGGFYRVHRHRGPEENLNSPGMDFVPLAFSKPCQAPCEHSDEVPQNRFYVYGVIARLAFLAAAREFAALGSST